MKLQYTIQKDDKFENLKEFLKVKFGISNRLLLTLKKYKKIFINGQNASIYSLLNINDNIEIDLDYEESNDNVVPTKMDLNIIYEDDFLLVLNKQPGLPIHPSMSHFNDSISNGVRYYFDSIGLHKKIRPVNRLDRDTSGAVIFAKNEYVQERLIQQMQNHSFSKEYIAMCERYSF